MNAYLRFIAKVEKGPDCWLWKGKTIRKGYGHFRLNGKLVYAHRYSYETFVGPIPEGMTIDHRCNNPPCVNPDHLQVVSKLQNNRLAKARRFLS
jgi:hypothetical protein